MAGDQDKAWVRAIGKKLRDDLGDCPTLPEDMLRLLDKLKEENVVARFWAKGQEPPPSKQR